MNARTPEVSPVGLSLAAGNAAVLRIFAEGPWLATTQQSELARKAGVSPKNIGRTIENFLREGLVHCPEPGDRIEITDAGRHALAVADFAAGRGRPPPAAGAAQPADPDALLLPHHAIRPNPLNPRRLNLGEPGQDPPTRDRQELDQLKASIAADLAMGGPGVLQSLVVFPPDAEGVHDLSAGERRWRAVGELIGEGVWPEGRPLRALQRERSAGLTAFVALVENGQRSNLSMLEEARAYAALVEETGWSARHAALQTGRDPRSVQQMLQVIRDARPTDLRRHQESPEDYTWEDLRRSVQEPKAAAEPEAEGRQLDVEDVAAALPYALDDHSTSLIDYHVANLAKLSAKKRLMVVELADKVFACPSRKRRNSADCARVVEGADPDVIMAGVSISWDDGGSIVSLAPSAMEALRQGGLLPHGVNRAPALRFARTAAGIAAARIDELEQSGGYITPWLDPSWRPGAKETSSPTSAGSPAPAHAADLSLLELITLLEVAHASAKACMAGTDHGGGWAIARRYWLDATASSLKARDLLAFSHAFTQDGPHVALTQAARAALDSRLGELDWTATPEALDLIAGHLADLGEPLVVGETYSTPWLNETTAGLGDTFERPDVPLSDTMAAMGRGEEEFAEAEAVLGDVARGLDSGDDFDPTALLQRAGVKFPLRVSGADRCVVDAAGEPVLDMVGFGDQADDLVEARLLLITTMLNAAAATWQSPQGAVLKGQRVAPTDPAVPIRRSITPELITCLEDGARAPSIAAHLRQVYGLDADAYRARWGLPRDYPLVAPNEQYRRSQDMKALGVEVPPLSDDGWEG